MLGTIAIVIAIVLLAGAGAVLFHASGIGFK